MNIFKILKGVFGVGKKSTIVTKKIIYDARTSPKARIKVLLIDHDDTIREKEYIQSVDGMYIYDPDEVNSTYEKTKIYKRVNEKSRIVSNVAIITPKYPKTVNFDHLKSDLGQLAISTMSKVLYSTIISDALGKPSDREKKFYLAIGVLLGWIAGMATAYIFIRLLVN